MSFIKNDVRKKAFTLIEVAIVLLLISIIVGAGLSFQGLNKDFFYLRDVAKNFSVALNTLSNLSQIIIEKPAGNFFCAYGIYFPDQTSYEALAFSTTTNLCETVFLIPNNMDSFINSNLANKKYVLQNQEITSSPIPTLSLNLQLAPGANLSFSTTTKDCSSNFLTGRLLIMYAYSYIDLFFIYQASADSWQRIDADYLYVCFRKNFERYTIRINRLGQINFER